MKIAYVDGKRVHIKDYVDTMYDRITCAHGHSVIPKRGTIKTHHFAHKNTCNCTGSNGMTQWHISWQDRANISSQEVRIINDNKLHIADTLIEDTSLEISSNCKGYVIEYQHSTMDTPTMRERESFYTKMGYHLVWVFDVNGWMYRSIRRIGDIITIRKTAGTEFPLNGVYTGSVTKVLDFGKRELLIVTKQVGMMISGRVIDMDTFDKLYIGNQLVIGSDDRWDRHTL